MVGMIKAKKRSMFEEEDDEEDEDWSVLEDPDNPENEP